MNTLCIGLFWFDSYEGKLFSVKMSVAEGIRRGFQDSPYIFLPLDPIKAWDLIRRMNPRWGETYSHEMVPHGRVYWEKGRLGFLIALSPSLKGKEEFIRREFGIRENDVCLFDYGQKNFFTVEDGDGVMKFRSEFPSYRLMDMPEEIRAAVLEGWLGDTSWHNDSMPSFEAHGLRLWTDFKEGRLREFKEGKRFSASRSDDESNTPLVEFEEERRVEAALELMRFAGVDVKTLEPAELITRLVKIVGLGFSFTTPVAEYRLGWGAEVQEALNSAVKALGERKAYETAFREWKNELARRRRV